MTSRVKHIAGSGPGTPPQSTRKRFAELEAMVQETVHEYTKLRRRSLGFAFKREKGRMPTEEELDDMQPIVGMYDPIVELAMVACNTSFPIACRIRAHAEVASFMRPKLQAIHVEHSAVTEKADQRRAILGNRLIEIVETLAITKSNGTIVDVEVE